MQCRVLPRVGLLGLLLASPLAACPQDGAKPIFDGKTLAGWEGDLGHWRVKDGAIIGQTSKDNPLRRNTFLIWRLGAVDDFELRLRYRITGHNSGIQYRSQDLGEFVVKGYQADMEAGDTWSGANYEERGRGILAKRGQKVVLGSGKAREVVGSLGDGKALQAHIKKGEWNDYRITARGRHLVHAINGTVMSDVVDNSPRQFKRSGILALQLHAGQPMKVEFRDIRLRRLHLRGAKKIVFVAGRRSHGFGAHEFHAGSLLLARLLNAHVQGVLATVYQGGWPEDPTAFDNADALVLYMDGGPGHPLIRHLDEVDRLMQQGVGLACLHYAVEVPEGEAGQSLRRWIGGYFEPFWSVNPIWEASFESLPEHPTTRGVRPFTLRDEWYYHMRFLEHGVTPILTAVPPDATRQGKNGSHSGNEYVRARMGMPEHVAWALQRADGGRGFGFTGGHFHWGWAHGQMRKLVLNALVWVAGAEVPAGGIKTPTPTLEELLANQDFPRPEGFQPASIRKLIRR